MTRAAAAVLVAAACSASCGGSQHDLPPYGEAVVFVDTDLPVPELASRLRVDLYAADGRWFESRDIGRSDPRDWPASFSVFSDDDAKEKLVLVRVRVYPQGVVRDYAGERFAPRPEYVAPRAARSLAELCGDPPELRFGERLTLRAGERPVTAHAPTADCNAPAGSGSVAARVVVGRRGRYRFDVANALPYSTLPTLALRSRCEDPASEVACMTEPRTADVFTPGHFPRFDVQLDPGTYFLVTTNILPAWPADLTLEGMALDAPLPQPEAITNDAQDDPSAPRLLRTLGGPEETPASEPLPSATIDRLIVVRLVPGERGSVRVVARGNCVGTMARLGEDPSRPDLATATTCIDTENVRAAVGETELAPTISQPEASVQGTFGSDGGTCEPSARDDVVCVPSGVFLFGSRHVSPTTSTRATTAPERVARMSRFWIDRREISVGQLRAASARGLGVSGEDVRVNDRPFPQADSLERTFERYCTWTSTPREREDMPVSCINWRLARAYCRMQGGDLPTEAQWEYAAAAAGRPRKTSYPWGDDPPTCDRAVFGRTPLALDAAPCADGVTQFGPIPISAWPAGDVTPLGILGLGGSMKEWVLDAAEPYAGACWRAAKLIDPACLDDDAPMRMARGAGWSNAVDVATDRSDLPGGIAANGIEPVATPTPTIGFRCAYAEAPR